MTLRYRASLNAKGVLRQVYHLEPSHLCRAYFTAMFPPPLTDLLRAAAAQAVEPRTVALVDADAPSSPVV